MGVNQSLMNDLRLDVSDTATVVDVSELFARLLQTSDLVAVMILLLAARVIKYLRIFPYWGPMVVAVVMTWLDPSVILYLGVTIGLTAALAVAFLVAFGAQVVEFSSLPASVFTLFTMSFAEDWHEVEGATFRPLNTIFYLFYVVFAVVLLNLFIGIVTDVYPKAREKSQQEWENLITDLMQEEILRRRERLTKPAGGSVVARLFPCLAPHCVSRDYAIRMARLRHRPLGAGSTTSAGNGLSVPDYLTRSRRLLPASRVSSIQGSTAVARPTLGTQALPTNAVRPAARVSPGGGLAPPRRRSSAATQDTGASGSSRLRVVPAGGIVKQTVRCVPYGNSCGLLLLCSEPLPRLANWVLWLLFWFVLFAFPCAHRA